MLRRPPPVVLEAPAPAPAEEEPRRRRRRGGRPVTALLLLVALAFLGIAVLRVAGIDGNAATVSALALTPYVTPAGLVLFLIAFGLRRRIIAVSVLLLAVSMVILVLPRVFPNEPPAARGEHVRVLAANVYNGLADATSLVNLVRDNNIDVLTVPELTEDEVPELDAAGLAELLPYRVLVPGTGSGGSGILSRFPVRQTVLVDRSELAQPSAVVDLPGRNDIEVLAAHVQAAVYGDGDVWRRELGQLPPANPARVRVLAGDFNSTLDHAAFRAVLDTGYVDAAEQTGKGLIATWSSWPYGPPVTIDHILVDHRCAIPDFAVLHLPGSDHNAVFAEIVLPN